MTAEPLTVTELDERTKEELAPPCGGRWNHVPCPDVATWAVTVICPTSKHLSSVTLVCDRHWRALDAGRIECKEHAPTILALISAERL